MPSAGKDEVVLEVLRLGSPNHEGPPARRPLAGFARKKSAEEVINIGAYNVRRDFLNKACEENLREGDFTGVPSAEVLRKAASLDAKGSRLSDDA